MEAGSHISSTSAAYAKNSRTSKVSVRWGILGCAAIGYKIGRALVLSNNGSIRAVASRDAEKASSFIRELCLKDAENDTYDHLVKRDDVDIIYVPLPSSMHLQWVGRIARSGKHVLCEKPAATSVDDLMHMLKACYAHNVQFMDGVMFMHHPRLARLKELLRDPFVGPVKRVTAAFSFPASNIFLAGGDIRTRVDGDPLGCLGDLGWYCVRIGLIVMRHEWPAYVTCRADCLTSEGIVTDCVGEVVWNLSETATDATTGTGGSSSSACSGTTASSNICSNAISSSHGGVSDCFGKPTLCFQASFVKPFRQWVEICSRSQRFVVEDFVIPKHETSAVIKVDVGSRTHHETKIVENIETYEIRDVVQEKLMVEKLGDICKSIKEGIGSLDMYWFDIALQTQSVIDALWQSIRRNGESVKVTRVQFQHTQDERMHKD